MGAIGRENEEGTSFTKKTFSAAKPVIVEVDTYGRRYYDLGAGRYYKITVWKINGTTRERYILGYRYLYIKEKHQDDNSWKGTMVVELIQYFPPGNGNPAQTLHTPETRFNINEYDMRYYDAEMITKEDFDLFKTKELL